MPNPNIAALAELTTGTLAWTMTSDQVTFHGSSISATNGATSSALECAIPTATNFTQTDKSATALANKMVVGLGALQQSSSGGSFSSVTQNSDAMTALFSGSDSMVAQVYDKVDMHYRVNPDTHATSVLDIEWTPNASSQMFGSGAYFSNVDQSEPFTKIFHDQRYWGDRNSGFRGISEQLNIKTKPGDCILVWGVSAYKCRWEPRNRESHTIGAVMSSNATTSYLNSMYFGFFSPSSFEEPYLLEKANQYKGHTGQIATTLANTLFGAANIQSVTTPKTLFTVPAEMSVKINSIEIANPEVPGMYVKLAITGLPAGTNSITNTSSNDVLTVASDPGAVTTTSITNFTRAKMGSNVNVLTQPLWLQAGDSLTAKVVCDQNLPAFENRDCDIIVSFETVKD